MPLAMLGLRMGMSIARKPAKYTPPKTAHSIPVNRGIFSIHITSSQPK
jgi:hypothetical protein